MKKSLVGFLLLSVVWFSQAAKSDLNVRVINFEAAIINTDLAKAEIAKLEKNVEYKKNLEEFERYKKEGEKLVEKMNKDGALMSPADKAALEAQIKSKQADVEHVIKKLNETKGTLMRALMIKMNQDMTAITKELIKSEKVGLLLPATPQLVLHYEPEFDLTAKLTARLNKKFPVK